MVWNYSGNPSATPLDAVRYLCGDVIREYPLAQDEEINFSIAQEGNLYYAAAAVAEALAAEFSRKVNKSVGDLRLDLAEQAKAYLALATRLRMRGALRISPIYVGGLSHAELLADLDNEDLTSPFFRRDMNENHSAGVMTPSLTDIVR